MRGHRDCSPARVYSDTKKLSKGRVSKVTIGRGWTCQRLNGVQVALAQWTGALGGPGGLGFAHDGSDAALPRVGFFLGDRLGAEAVVVLADQLIELAAEL